MTDDGSRPPPRGLAGLSFCLEQIVSVTAAADCHP